METSISVRYDDGIGEFIVSLTIPGIRTFETSSQLLSEAINLLGEQLDDEGI